MEVNCETDFVSKNDDFLAFSQAVADLVASRNPADLAALAALPLSQAGFGPTVEDVRKGLIGKIGENISVRRFKRYADGARLARYLHGTRIGVLVEFDGDEVAAKDVAMHVAAMKPAALSSAEVPAELVDKERKIAAEKAAESGKPAEIVAKMVDGAVQKFLKEVSLFDQAFVKAADGKQTVARDAQGQEDQRQGLHAVRGGRGHREACRRLRRRGGGPGGRRQGAVSPGRRCRRLPARLTLAPSLIGTRCMPAYKRILLKLSGEALMGDDAYGINRATIVRMVREIQDVTALGVEVAVVIGGGNIFRGVAGGSVGMDRATADYMGMLATVMNSLALADTMRQEGMTARVMSAIAIEQVVEPYVRPKALQYLEEGKIVVFAAGTGNPFFTTDTAAALRGAEIGAQMVLKATKVDGVYSADPKKDASATRYANISFDEVDRHEPAGHGRDGLCAVPRPEAADQGVQHLQARRAEARGDGRGRGHAGARLTTSCGES